MAWKSMLKPEGSIVAGIGVMGAVYATYQLSLGSMASAQATDANHPVLESNRKKAGYTSFILVAAIGLVTKDANIIVLGSASIIAMELQYRHSIMAHPASGIMQPPGNEVYNPPGEVVPMYPDINAAG